MTNSTPSTTNPLPLPEEYKKGFAWAEGVLTVIPGDRVTKAPLVSFKKHLRSGGRKAATSEDLISYRLLGTEGANPLLILESPYSDAYCICVIDIDHAPATRDVFNFLVKEGVVTKEKEPLIVTTGREGGGQHLYFLCEAQQAHLYSSKNGASLFGSYIGSDGKKHGCVDCKSVGAYVVAPGAVHKSGKVYKAWYRGQEVHKLSDVIAKLPVMPLKIWNQIKMGNGPDAEARARAEAVEWVIAGPEWAEVAKHRAGDKIVCPWCLRRGSNSALSGKQNLQINEGGSAFCHREGRMYRAAKVRRDSSDQALNWASIEGHSLTSSMEAEIDGYLADLEPKVGEEPLRNFREDPVAWAIDTVGEMLDEELGPKASHMGAIFPEDDPLKEWESEAVRAAVIAERAGLLHRRMLCQNGPTTFVAAGNAQDSHRNSCRKWHCPDCGPFKLEALRIATAATLQVQRHRSTGILISLIPVERCHTWNSVTYDYKAWDLLTGKLKRWASKGEERGWLALRTKPTQVTVIAWADATGLSLWPLAEGAESGSLREVCAAALEGADLQAWCAWREAEKASRSSMGDDRDVKIEILLAPSDLKGKIARLLDFALGWDRKGLSTARALVGAGWTSSTPKGEFQVGEDFASLITYKGREVLRLEGEILQQALIPEEVGPGHERLNFGEGFSASKLLKRVVEETPSLHAHKTGGRKPIRKASLNVEDLLS